MNIEPLLDLCRSKHGLRLCRVMSASPTSPTAPKQFTLAMSQARPRSAGPSGVDLGLEPAALKLAGVNVGRRAIHGI
ncbi:hypothetical protein TWF225_006392 [Orbilia oligospora]|uniref:Uncharacterized protein n=1 Tax=Orbilia oligospora TaxID=2813651 RepID=A0A7C8P737_ORBOL|nr:hypothetical protein TWF751_007792 [Orbilia oligospora]KAF3182472.1 hypothetical protein TWF225_006392 [Orbilia oligospora]KAF3258441.1 hypothetical protein TWF128_004688 [Orbilia oligospora]KAF3271127.1 hypothetical protein TWF217_005545 [Orbilia oligospora]KAF3282101.1 hypothetical protein TWF132_010803 [Orbilia oligospora]